MNYLRRTVSIVVVLATIGLVPAFPTFERVASAASPAAALSTSPLKLPLDTASSSMQTANAAPGEPLTVAKLTTENLENPVGIAAAAPRLSWQLQSLTRGKAQTAYQIQVATTAAALEADAADVWDSGQVNGDGQVLIPYAGPALRNASTYRWRVRVWDEAGTASVWSPGAQWTTGMADTSGWRASWMNPAGPVRAGGSYFRKSFTLPQLPSSALLFVSGRGSYERGPDWQGFCCQQAYSLARGIYQPMLNGNKVGDAELESQPVDSRVRSLYRVWDVTSQLRQGSNVLGLLTGEDSDVLAQLNVRYPDGSTAVVASDGTWQSKPGPVTRAHTFHGETFDARLQDPQWLQPEKLSPGWTGVDVVAGRGVLDPALNEPSKVIRNLKSVRTTQPARNVYVLDFGENISGRTALSLTIPQGATVTIKHGERLTNGRVDNSVLGAQQTSTFIGDGSTSQFHAAFGYAGFRWAEVVGLSQEPGPDMLVAQEIRNAVADTGNFSSASALMNRLHTVDKQTQANGLHGIPVDTPTREKRGWMADAHIAAEATINNFGMATFYAKFIQDMADAQRASGLVPDIVPVEAAGDWQSRSDPAWGVATVLVPYYTWRAYGDREVLSSHYESMSKWMDHTASTTTGFLVTNPSMAWGNDWVAIEPTDSRLFRSGFYYWSAMLMSSMATELGKNSDAAKYNLLANNVSTAINKAFFNSQTSSYGKSQFSNAFPLLLGLVPSSREQDVVTTLVSKVMVDGGGHFSGGLPGAKYIVDALENYGRSDIVDLVVSRTDSPGWAYMLAQGSTSVWEDWHGSNSLDHPMFTFIDAWLYSAVAGIRQTTGSTGYRRLTFDPQITKSVDSASGSLETPYGKAAIAWTNTNGLVSETVTVPVGTTATVRIPESTVQSVTESALPASGRPGILSVDRNGADAVVEIGPGTYVFSTDKSLGHLTETAQISTAIVATVQGSGVAPALKTAAAANEAAAVAAQLHYVSSGAQDTESDVLSASEALRVLGTALAPGSGVGLNDTQLQTLKGQLTDAATALAAVLDTLTIRLTATAGEEIISAGSSTDLTVTVSNSGPAKVDMSAIELAFPQGWTVEAIKKDLGEIAAGSTMSGRFRLTAPADSPGGSVAAQVLTTMGSGSAVQRKTTPVKLAVGNTVSTGAVALQPRVVSAGGQAYVRTALKNLQAAHTADVSLSLINAPAGWTAEHPTAVHIPAGATMEAVMPVSVAAEALTGTAQVLVSDSTGRKIDVLETTLLVRGASGCAVDPTGEACLPSSSEVIANFESGPDGFSAGSNAATVTATTDHALANPWLGQAMLYVSPQPGVPATSIITTQAKLGTPRPLHGAAAVSLAVRPEAVAQGLDFTVTVSIEDSAGHKAKKSAAVAQDRWNTVEVPVPNSGLTDIKSMEISYRSLTQTTLPAGSLAVDAITADYVDYGRNLAAGQPVGASSSVESDGWRASQLVDGIRVGVPGNLGFRTNEARPADGTADWVSVDLGSRHNVATVVLFPRTAPFGEDPSLDSHGLPLAMTLQVSDDGHAWRNVESTSGTPRPDGALAVEVEGGAGRYVRVFASPAAAGASGLAFAELEIYGPSPMRITEQPTAQSVDAGADAMFSAFTVSNPRASIQWQHSNDGGHTYIDIKGAIERTLMIPCVKASDDGSLFRAKIVAADGSPVLVTLPTRLEVKYMAPRITQQPSDVYASPLHNDPVILKSAVAGTALALQWQSSVGQGSQWVPVAGATDASLPLSVLNGSAAPGERFRLLATTPLGEEATSSVATFRLGSVPTVASEVANIAVQPGSPAVVSSLAGGSPAPAVQWFGRGNGSGDWKALTGATDATLKLGAAEVSNGASYRMVATNEFGSTTGTPIVVSVLQPLPVAVGPYSSPADALSAAGVGALGMPSAPFGWANPGGGLWHPSPEAGPGIQPWGSTGPSGGIGADDNATAVPTTDRPGLEPWALLILLVLLAMIPAVLLSVGLARRYAGPVSKRRSLG